MIRANLNPQHHDHGAHGRRVGFPAGLICLCLGLGLIGCRGYQYGHLVKPTAPDMVGSHTAGSEVYKPLVEEAVTRLLDTCEPLPVGSDPGLDALGFEASGCRVCFVGVENKSAEELGDFKDQIYQMIDTQINRTQSFEAISRRMVDAALVETRLRPDSLFVPSNMQAFTDVLQRHGQPIDYLLYATLTSGTTERNASTQRDYLLTLEIVDTRTGAYRKEQAEIRKGYHKSPLGKLANYSLWPTSGR